MLEELRRRRAELPAACSSQPHLPPPLPPVTISTSSNLAEATFNGVNIVQAVATLYRDGGASAGWALVSPDPLADDPATLDGTAFAVLTLILLAGETTVAPFWMPGMPVSQPNSFADIFRPSQLQSMGGVPEDGLTDFLHVFGSTGATAKATFPWASNYVPG